MTGRGTWPPPATREPGAFYNVTRPPPNERRAGHPVRDALLALLSLSAIGLVLALPVALLVLVGVGLGVLMTGGF